MAAISTTAGLSERIRWRAREVGFDLVGIAPLGASQHANVFRSWLDSGYAGEMSYLSRDDAFQKRTQPQELLPGAKSAVVVGCNYFPGGSPRDSEAVQTSEAVFARYARNDDYHELLTPRLIQLQEWIAAEVGPLRGRSYVDTGPVLERELAVRAGLGWIGRNTMVIAPGNGSYFFLGAILLDVELEYDEPFPDDHCGTCTNCLTACPTGALLGRDESGAPIMDARRCISYLTIELKGPIPRELRPLIGNRVYGCDICQEACPWNAPKFVQLTAEESFWPREGVQGARLIELMAIDQTEFSRRFSRSPVKRAKRRGLLRNVAVALGNWGSPEGAPALISALEDVEPLVRGHAAWALGQIRTDAAYTALRARSAVEDDAWVREEIDLALLPR